jgi:hypothetical protein
MSGTQLNPQAAQVYAVRDANGKVDLNKTASNYTASNPGAQVSYNQAFKQFEGSFSSNEISRGAVPTSMAFSSTVANNDGSLSRAQVKQSEAAPSFTTAQNYGFPPSPFQFVMTA